MGIDDDETGSSHHGAANGEKRAFSQAPTRIEADRSTAGGSRVPMDPPAANHPPPRWRTDGVMQDNSPEAIVLMALEDSSPVEETTRTAPVPKKFELKNRIKIKEKKTKATTTAEAKIVYGLAWSKLYQEATGSQPFRLLATCSRRLVSVYRMNGTPPDYKNGPVDLSMTYQVTMKHGNECFYACEFTGGGDGPTPQDICVGGMSGIIFVLDIVSRTVKRSLIGHGMDVLDLKVSPMDGNLLLSASQDRSCRLWNVRLGTAIAVFAGREGHLEAVNSIQWHYSGRMFCSAGSDLMIKIWEFTSETDEGIAAGNTADAWNADTTASTEQLSKVNSTVIGVKLDPFPIFSTLDAHCHWVDSVHYVGDLIVSKAADGTICLWSPIIERKTMLTGESFRPPRSKMKLLQTFSLPHFDFYFVKIAVDPTCHFIAAGNQQGRINVWEIGAPEASALVWTEELGHSVTIRNLLFSPDGGLLVVSTDSGAIYRFSVIKRS